jgi:hypothetical protein
VAGIAAVLSWGVASTRAPGAPTYTSFAEVKTNAGGDQDSGGQTAFASFSTGTASATLYPGAILLTSSNAGAQTRGSASGEVTFTDLLFEKLPGFEGNPDTFSAALEVSQSTTAPSGDMSANLSVSNADTGTGGGRDSTTTPGQTLIVSLSNLEVGELYTVEFGGSVRTVTGGPDDVSLTLRLNAASVLDLPEGYTANSTDGMIVDNVYRGQVPEPSVLALVGLGGLVFLRRRPAA